MKIQITPVKWTDDATGPADEIISDDVRVGIAAGIAAEDVGVRAPVVDDVVDVFIDALDLRITRDAINIKTAQDAHAADRLD